MTKLAIGHRYLIQSNGLGKSISDIVVLEESQLAYRIQWAPDHITWELKDGFLIAPFPNNPEYKFLEELSPHPATPKGQ